ncbi:hypothetical protein CDAR_602141 [Caerostris darwini]|uniref:Uncharacterized protein n=1 Tax=Caerostris darwini TaxID=1538125 RepID=A0AAV4RDC4_9ARAC|nr:hypothetical protein CDAR_602141 [Caerostris darwini]
MPAKTSILQFSFADARSIFSRGFTSRSSLQVAKISVPQKIRLNISCRRARKSFLLLSPMICCPLIRQKYSVPISDGIDASAPCQREILKAKRELTHCTPDPTSVANITVCW